MNKAFSAIFFIAFTLCGCKKDTSLDCTPVPLPNNGGSSLGWNYVPDQNYVEGPSYNPNNSNQVTFIEITGSEHDLCAYDMQANTKLKLYTGNILYKPDWGTNNWILFDVDNDIYKIKPTGDSLTRLTFNGISCGPKWSPDGSEYLFRLYAGSGYVGDIFASSDGKILDSLYFSFSETSAWTGSVLADGGTTGFFVYDLTTQAQKQINYSFDLSSYSGTCFVSASSFVWADNSGIYLTNFQTEQTTKIKSTCDSKTYLFPTYSTQSSKIIWNRVTKTPLSSTNLGVSSDLVMMNPDGSGEQKMTLP